MKNKFLLFSGIIISLAVFTAVFTVFYVNRDSIYYFLIGDTVGVSNTEYSANIDNSNNSGENLTGNNISESVNFANPDNWGEYIKNIVFIGDSITHGFDLYRDLIKFNGEDILKDAVITATPGYGLKHALSDDIKSNSYNLIYDEKPMKPEDIIALRDEKYVFICLGLNDLGSIKTDEYIEQYKKLLDNIQEKSPDKSIVILSVTPLVYGMRGGNLNNTVIAKANELLIELAAERDMLFIDWAEAIRDENNSLYKNLSSDGYCHLNVEAYNRLIEYLLDLFIMSF